MTENSRRLNVLALAVGGNVTEGILKALRRSAVPHRVVGADVSALQMGLYTADRSYVGPYANEARFTPWLIDLCQREAIDIILSGCEPVLWMLAPLRPEIERETGAVCLVNEPRIIDICEDKLTTCRWLQSQELAYPRYADAADTQAVQQLVADCGYPLLAKRRRGGGSVGLYELRSDEDVDYVCRKPGYVVQEILGDHESEYTVGVFCDRHSTARGTIAMWRALHAGTTYRAVLGEFPEVCAEAERIVAALRPVGPCNIQLRMTPRGPVCFEINPRFSGTTPLRAFYGFNEADAALRHFVLDEEEIALPRVTSGVALRYWNELYVSPEAVAQLEAAQCLDDPHAYPVHIEDYGARP